MLVDFDKDAKGLGIELRLVGTPALKQVLGSVVETASIPFFPSVNEARALAA
jgi:hypothetical protein